MTLNCIIIDDEPLAAELLASYAKRTPFINLVGVYNGAVEAMRAIREKEIDLCFLDIQMPELSGLELASIIPDQTKIVFTTAFSQYAVEGYKVDAIGYLLKPITYEDFLITARKAAKIIGNHPACMKCDSRQFYVKSEYKLIRICLDDILYIEGDKDYVKIFLEGREAPVQTLLNMKKIEERLPQPEFLRTHRSYIVHVPKAEVIDRLHFVIGDMHIPISESYKIEVMKFLERHSVS